ncbi:MAG: 50S ribosomal protein L5 [Candidatus Peregrinibacteria bacterium GW2011_GWA2_47_7]|nr:MAG: 50S ribosomal protein L5 [Candidatus Peregrinibacteria bacterium GW2011_GWA2_47_7]
MTTGKSTSLKEQFKTVMVPELTKALGLEKASEYVVPRVKYIKVNVGVGSYVGGGKDHEDVVSNVAKITGQRPVVSKSRMAISNFKFSQGFRRQRQLFRRHLRAYRFPGDFG